VGGRRKGVGQDTKETDGAVVSFNKEPVSSAQNDQSAIEEVAESLQRRGFLWRLHVNESKLE